MSQTQSSPFSFLKNAATAGIIDPVDGALVVLNGQTVDIPEGSVKQYSNIQIDSGGVLRITGNTGAWTEIGCAGDCIVNGQIIARAGYPGQATHSGGTFTKTSAFGLGSLSYSITQRAGGNGGNSSNNFTPGGLQSDGRGGGGGGGKNEYNFITGERYGGAGGAGGSNGSQGELSPIPVNNSGGIGGGLQHGQSNKSTSTYQGVAAWTVGGDGSGGGGGGSAVGGEYKGSFIVSLGNGGGGGGYKGHHGKGLVLYIEGNLSGSGIILCSGANGFNGGSVISVHPNSSGSGGGGGAGGSGGHLAIRYKSTSGLPSFSASGGGGGAGGSGERQGFIDGGRNGANGQSGLNGSLSVLQI